MKYHFSKNYKKKIPLPVFCKNPNAFYVTKDWRTVTCKRCVALYRKQIEKFSDPNNPIDKKFIDAMFTTGPKPE